MQTRKRENSKTHETRKRRKRENAESAKTQKARKRRKRENAENAKTRNTQSKQRNAKNDQTSHGRRTEMQNTNKRKHENAKTRKRFSRFSRFLGFLVFSVFSFSRFSRFLVFSFRWPHPCGHAAFVMCLEFFHWTCLIVSCTCSCVFYNGFLFMKYILAQGYLFVITCNFLSICRHLLRHCTCVCQNFTLLWHFTFPFRCNLQLFAGRSRA